jgi:CPA2 family monovalent cation:H+ antiporter-2
MFEVSWIKELMIVLATAGVVVPLFGRLRFGVVPGFLIAGVVLGPGGLGGLVGSWPWLKAVTFSDPERVRPFAELGVLFLLFLIGLEISFERLWAMRRHVFGTGPAQFVLSAFLLVLGGLWFGAGLKSALVLGLGLALSSTAIVTQLMIEAHRFASPVGRLSLAVLLFQDLMVVPLVIVVGLLGGAAAVSGAVLGGIALALASLAVIIVAGRTLIRPLMRLAAAMRSRELVVAIAVFIAVGMALITAEVGLSPALGAFLAGILLGESEYRHHIEVDIEPFKGLLLGLFFMTVGMSVDLFDLGVGPVALVAAVLAILVLKGAAAYGSARLFGAEPPVAAEAAFLLAGAGEFAFVIFALAGRGGLIAGQPLQLAETAAALSMLAIPVLAVGGRHAAGAISARLMSRAHGARREGEELSDHVVIGGFGRVGETVASILTAEGIAYVGLDLNAELVARRRRAGRPVFYGDASRREMLERVGGSRARAFVVTTDEPVAAERMVRAIRAAWPKVAIHARALDADHARRLSEAGATDVVPEALEGSLQLAGRVLGRIGLPDEAVDARLAVQREAEIDRLVAG